MEALQTESSTRSTFNPITTMKIDLGTNYDKTGHPELDLEAMEDMSEKGDGKIEFPCLYINDAPADLLKIAKEGKAVIEFSVKSRTEGEDYDGDERNSIELKIKSFEPIESRESKPDSVESEAVAAVKEYFSKK